MPEALSVRPPSRRRFLQVLGGVATVCVTGCQAPSDLADRFRRPQDDDAGRLTFQPGARPGAGGSPGDHVLEGSQDAPPARLYVPVSARDGATLVVCLHGAGSPAGRALERLRPYADEHRLILLAPKSVGTSWDVTRGGFGPDLANIDALLRNVSARYRIRRYAVNGFSDGASYALSLGVANGRLFDSVIAWSPGFRVPTAATGRPRFFVSHGTADDILPIRSTSRRIVPDLEERGYDVTYVEFDGAHVVPGAIREQSVRWLSRRA